MTNYEYYIIEKQGGLDVKNAISYLQAYKEVVGDSTKYWYQFICKKLDRLGWLTVGKKNPPPRIFVHLATIAIMTQEFQSLLLREERLFEYEYGEYLENLSITELNELYEQFVKGKDFLYGDDEDWRDGCEDEYDLRNGLSERLIENNRNQIAEFLTENDDGNENFIALVLTVMFPSGDYKKYAEEIAMNYPIDVEEIRMQEEFNSYLEYMRYISSEDASDFVYGECGLMDSSIQRAFDWWEEGCYKMA